MRQPTHLPPRLDAIPTGCRNSVRQRVLLNRERALLNRERGLLNRARALLNRWQVRPATCDPAGDAAYGSGGLMNAIEHGPYPQRGNKTHSDLPKR